MKQKILVDQLPPHKVIRNTNYVVDYFKHYCIDSNHYFLSHFHADHYGGLTKSFDSILYCSKTTAELVNRQCRVKKENIQILDMYQWYEIEPNNFVLLIDANHCPGAVCFVFKIKNEFYLHCGDFRCSDEFYGQDFSKINTNPIKLYDNDYITKKIKLSEIILAKIEKCYAETITDNYYEIETKKYSLNTNQSKNLPTNIFGLKFHNIYLDNTFEHYRSFDKQKNIIHKIIDIIEKKIYGHGCLVPFQYHFLFATYSVGKEKIFLSVAEYFDFTILVNKYKAGLLNCFDKFTKEKIDKEIKQIVQSYPAKKKKTSIFDIKNSETKEYKYYGNVFDRITEKECKNQISVISMLHVNKVKINDIIKDIKAEKICIFVGTGWRDEVKFLERIKSNGTKVKKGVEVVYLPYSEHSSHDELRLFKEKMSYNNIVNTVKNKD